MHQSYAHKIIVKLSNIYFKKCKLETNPDAKKYGDREGEQNNKVGETKKDVTATAYVFCFRHLS